MEWGRGRWFKCNFRFRLNHRRFLPYLYMNQHALNPLAKPARNGFGEEPSSATYDLIKTLDNLIQLFRRNTADSLPDPFNGEGSDLAYFEP